MSTRTPRVSRGQKQEVVNTVFAPNIETGISEWVERSVFETNPILNWGNNGNARHGVYFGDTRFVWESRREGTRVTALRTYGFNPDNIANRHTSRPIRHDIHEYHKRMGCVVCGSKSSLVTDHKNDLYNDDRVFNSNTQTIDDFQCLCNHCNLQKRQVSKETIDNGRRYGATNIPSLRVFGIDFISGDDTFDPEDINAMKGTYWYDPVAFMNYIKNNTHN